MPLFKIYCANSFVERSRVSFSTRARAVRSREREKERADEVIKGKDALWRRARQEESGRSTQQQEAERERPRGGSCGYRPWRENVVYGELAGESIAEWVQYTQRIAQRPILLLPRAVAIETDWMMWILLMSIFIYSFFLPPLSSSLYLPFHLSLTLPCLPPTRSTVESVR